MSREGKNPKVAEGRGAWVLPWAAMGVVLPRESFSRSTEMWSVIWAVSVKGSMSPR